MSACQCKREINHVNSMMLMLMEAIADKNWESAETYQDITKEAIKSVGKCSNTDVSSAIRRMENVKDYLITKEIRPTMRVLQDTFWEMIGDVCKTEV